MNHLTPVSIESFGILETGVFIYSSSVRLLRYIAVFLVALSWFAVFQPWGSFVDPDAFYHAKMASLMSQRGLIPEFPWLDLTSFSKPFANHHVLFHAGLVPFVITFGVLPGAQAAGVVFAAVFITLFYGLLRALGIRKPELFTALLLVLPPVIIRMSLAKASPFAVGFACLGIVALLLRRPAWAFIAGLLFVLFHGGWLILPILQAAVLVGLIAFDAIVDDKGWKFVPETRVFAASLLGIAVGLLLHPYSATLLPFLWIQVVKIGINTPTDRVIMGQEWYPYEIKNLILALGPLVLVFIAVAYGLILARREPFDRNRARQVLGLVLPAGALLVLTFKSMRFAEYFTPIAVMLAAVMFELVDVRRMLAEWKPLKRPLKTLLIALSIFVVGRGIAGAWAVLHEKPMPLDQFSETMAELRKHVPSGSRVFHSDWSLFPQLFALDDRYRYVAGLDPTFLLEADPELSDAYTAFTLGKATSSAYELIHDRLGASAAVIEMKGYEHMIEALDKDSRFERVHQDSDAMLYLVK